MTVLDTNILSELVRPSPHPAVTGWLAAQPMSALWTTAVTLYELRLGLSRLPPGRRRRDLEIELDRVLATAIDDRVCAFDPSAAEAAAVIAAGCQAVGRPMDIKDVLIAGTVASRGATLATRNTRHFAQANIPLVDPWSWRPTSP